MLADEPCNLGVCDLARLYRIGGKTQGGEEEGRSGMDQYEIIRTAPRKCRKGIRELAREFGHHWKTI